MRRNSATPSATATPSAPTPSSPPCLHPQALSRSLALESRLFPRQRHALVTRVSEKAKRHPPMAMETPLSPRRITRSLAAASAQKNAAAAAGMDSAALLSRPKKAAAGKAQDQAQTRAAREFAGVEEMVKVGEELFGPYEWERFDLLVLPPSFPYGGMENPSHQRGCCRGSACGA